MTPMGCKTCAGQSRGPFQAAKHARDNPADLVWLQNLRGTTPQTFCRYQTRAGRLPRRFAAVPIPVSPFRFRASERFATDEDLPSPPRPVFNAAPFPPLVFARLKKLLTAPATRQLLAWCLPALLIGLVLRVVLTVHMPFAFFHDDASDFLHTTDRLLFEHKLELHAKKTFLVPILFTLPFFSGLPALVVIPVMQHLTGLVTVLLVGWLCRLWLSFWRVAIVPLTVLVAINPFFLWYEHTLMAETVFIFVTLLVALAGTLYAIERSRGRFIFLLVALVLEAGARPEGKLIFGFGLFLVALLHARTWRVDWPRFAIMLVVALVTAKLTKTAQTGLLLYTSVVRLTPTKLKCAPGFDPYIAPLRADLQQRWEEAPNFPKVRDRRAVAAAVEQYLDDRTAGDGEIKRGSVDAFCLKLAKETCLRNFGYLPTHIYHKFRIVSNEAPSLFLDNDMLFDKQREAFVGSLERTLKLSRGLTGRELKSEAELQQFIDTHYGEVPWFNAWQRRWLAGANHFRFADRRVPNPDWPTVSLFYYGVPFYFLIGALGLIVVMFRRGVLQPFHIAWGLTLLAFFDTIMLTANVRPRFRYVFEPFWFLYLALLLDCLATTIAAPFRRRALTEIPRK